MFFRIRKYPLKFTPGKAFSLPGNTRAVVVVTCYVAAVFFRFFGRALLHKNNLLPFSGFLICGEGGGLYFLHTHILSSPIILNIKMIPQQWTSPCGNSCTQKYAALTQIPWRVFCKKGCDTDGDSWDDCLSDCNEICYKDPVIKDHQWSAYIDRSPGHDDNSAVCFQACITGCAFKFHLPNGIVDGVHPKRPPKPENVKKPFSLPAIDVPSPDDVTATSA